MNDVGVIKVDSMETMVVICAGLVREGVTFSANTITMTITLTGGY